MPSEVKAQDTTSLASIKTVNEAATQSRALLAGMEQAAADADTTLNGIYQDAQDAQTAADSAKQSADTAYINLSQIQSVLEVAQWIATHGTYVKATLFNPNATYYTITATQVTEPSDDDKDSQGVLIYYELDNGIYVRTTDTSVQTGKTYYRVTGTPVAQPSAEHVADYYTLAVSEAMADYVQSHLALTDDGLWIIKDGSGYKLKLTDYGSYIVAPDGTTVVNQNTADGNIIRALSGTVIAHLGYGEGQSSQSGTAYAPYYTFGTRKTTNIPYDSTATYSVGDLCVYNDKLHVCSAEITTPEPWNSSHWKLAIGNWSLAEGNDTTASGWRSHTEGQSTTASGDMSHAEGAYTTAYGSMSHVEGTRTTASGDNSHAEGRFTTASGNASHVEGTEGTASGDSSHAEGRYTRASGDNSHAEGQSTIASGDNSHAEGYMTSAHGLYSHAQNSYTATYRRSQTVMGEFNKIDTHGADETERGKYALIIGNGDINNVSNGFTVDWDGKVECGNYQGKLTALLDLTHPKGSTYGTVLPPTINGHSYDDGNLTDADIDACGDTWFDPRIMWGGTWAKLPEGYILLSGSESGSYQVGTGQSTSSGYKEYGANDRRIEDANIAHGHGFTQPTITSYFRSTVNYASGSAARPYTSSGSSSTTDWAKASGGAVQNLGTPSQRANFNVMQKSIAVYTWIRTA